MLKGRLFLFASAVLYGVIPCLSAFAYRGGVNGVTLIFLRSAISLPFFYLNICIRKRDIRLPFSRLSQVIILGLFGGTIPVLLLYLSYRFIPTRIATAMHFIYPVVVVMSICVIYRQRLPRITVCSALLTAAGIYMFVELNGSLNITGAVLALLSGFFYSFYIIYLNRTGLDKVDHIVLSFYAALIMSVTTLVFGISSGSLYFNFSVRAWIIVTIISCMASFCAMPLFQLGIRYCGTAEAAIFSALEPVTDVILGAVVLGEFIGYSRFVGTAFIILSVLLIQRRETTRMLNR